MRSEEKTMDVGESTLKRREFLSVGGATIAGAAIGGREGGRSHGSHVAGREASGSPR